MSVLQSATETSEWQITQPLVSDKWAMVDEERFPAASGVAHFLQDILAFLRHTMRLSLRQLQECGGLRRIPLPDGGTGRVSEGAADG